MTFISTIWIALFPLFASWDAMKYVIIWIPTNIFYVFVELPLRMFYFMGPGWENLDDGKICYELGNRYGSGPEWYINTPEKIAECEKARNRVFGSFKAKVLFFLYCFLVFYIVFHILCRCCLIKPAVREIRKILEPKKTVNEEEQSKLKNKNVYSFKSMRSASPAILNRIMSPKRTNSVKLPSIEELLMPSLLTLSPESAEEYTKPIYLGNSPPPPRSSQSQHQRQSIRPSLPKSYRFSSPPGCITPRFSSQVPLLRQPLFPIDKSFNTPTNDNNTPSLMDSKSESPKYSEISASVFPKDPPYYLPPLSMFQTSANAGNSDGIVLYHKQIRKQ